MQVWLDDYNLEKGGSDIFLSMNADVKIVHIQRNCYRYVLLNMSSKPSSRSLKWMRHISRDRIWQR